MIFDLKVTYDLEGKYQSPPKHNRDLNEDVLQIIYQGDPSLSEGLWHREKIIHTKLKIVSIYETEIQRTQVNLKLFENWK